MTMPPIDGLEAMRVLGLAPPFSIEKDERTTMFGGEQPTAGVLEDEARKALKDLYGEEFPLAQESPPEEDDWARWAKSLWDRHSAAMDARLHLVYRNRLFRKGMQWVSAVGVGPWREPPKPKDAARVVRNFIGPALDQRIAVITEQRPGFRATPATQDPVDMKRAEAQQFALEYQFEQQLMPRVESELAYWSGTDGVAFGEVYWHPERGPWHEFKLPDGTPLDAQGMPAPPGSPPMQARLGDACTRVRRIEQIRVSAEATAITPPWYVVIKDVMPKAQALREYGTRDFDTRSTDSDEMNSQSGITRMGMLLPDEEELLREQDIVDRITVYCEKSEFLPQGLTLIVVGGKVVFQDVLLFGIIPVFRQTDGSSDPSYFPTPIMDQWIDPQMRINAVLSKWVENVRLNAGVKLIAKENAIAGETLIGGTMTVVGVKGLGPVNDIMRPLDAFSLSQDALKLIEDERKTFEDLSGWNDVSRGSFSSEQSGRAILAIREQLERVFAPPVGAAAQAMTDWAKITLAVLKWGYTMPRTVTMLGAGRPDLARVLTQDDFDGTVDVWIDPETLMPMPRALRLFLLKEMRQMGDISPQEYRRRLPFAWVRSIGTPDEDHEARARRVVEAIRQSANPMALPMLWQDNEAIHQDVLERELILPDDVHPMIRQAAHMRWTMLAQQAQMKYGMTAPVGPQQVQRKPGGGAPNGMSAQSQPMLGGSPGMAAAPVLQVGGRTDQQAAATQFDRSSAR